MASVKQDINIGLIFFVGIVGSIVLYISIVGTTAWFHYEREQIVEARYAADKNRDWINMRDEQYANIGDDVGNATIYAAADDVAVASDSLSGWRYTSEQRDRLVMPIHEAMARMVNDAGGSTTATAMMAADRAVAKTVNNAYASPFIVADDDQTNQDAERVTLE